MTQVQFGTVAYFSTEGLSRKELHTLAYDLKHHSRGVKSLKSADKKTVLLAANDDVGSQGLVNLAKSYGRIPSYVSTTIECLFQKSFGAVLEAIKDKDLALLERMHKGFAGTESYYRSEANDVGDPIYVATWDKMRGVKTKVKWGFFYQAILWLEEKLSGKKI